MATKTAKTSKQKPVEVGIMFKAPHEIRGAIRSVSAWSEMNGVRINGRIPAEKDIWAWIAAAFYNSGEDHWRESMANGAKAYSEMIDGGKP